MFDKGNQVIYKGKVYVISEKQMYSTGRTVYKLIDSNGYSLSAYETSLQPLESSRAEEIEYSAKNAPIEKSGGHLYLNFFDNLIEGLGERGWVKEDFYTLSLTEQYEILKRKLGIDAPEKLQDFVARCFPITTATYCISMPAFEREIQTRTRKDGTPGVQYVNNVVIRPDLSDSSRRMMAKLPPQYDVILIGDITFGSVISFTVKGIELIDSKVAKFGEYKISCLVACAFTGKQLNNGRPVPDYGSVGLKDPVLTRDFIDRLCTEVYPVPNPEYALGEFDKWKRYLDFRKYYLGVKSAECEKIDNAFPVLGYVVTKKAYKKNHTEWSKHLLRGHAEFTYNEQVILDKKVDGADDFPLICVVIDKNRKKILSEIVGKGERRRPKYEDKLRRYTRETLGLSETKPKYNEEGSLIDNNSFYSYTLGERFIFTSTDVEPDYSEIEEAFENDYNKKSKEIDAKYSGIKRTETEVFMEKKQAELKNRYSKKLEEYRLALKNALNEDVKENNDKEIKEQYEADVVNPIRDRYENEINILEKELSNLQKATSKDSKKKNKGSDNPEDKRHSIEARIKLIPEEMEKEIASNVKATPIAAYYQRRNAKRVEERKKSYELELQKALKTARENKLKQLDAQYEETIKKEKSDARAELERVKKARIAEKRENETVRRYEIFFRPENVANTLKELQKDIPSEKYQYLTYDNRAEKAKIDRQERALNSLLRGYVKNPYLSSYLFSPKTLSSTTDTSSKSLEWCLEGRLNESQQAAVKGALASDSIFLLQGPPGTGKTQVIAEITAQLVKEGKKVLISSETHKAIDNVFERLPKMPEIRPLRLIPSNNGKESNYSPERLVDNLYLNIRESLQKQVDIFEHFEEHKGHFSEEMRKLDQDYKRMLELHRKNKKTASEQANLKEKDKQLATEIELLKEKVTEATEQIEMFLRTKKYIEDYRFDTEDVKVVFIELYAKKVKELLSEFTCFSDRNPEDLRAIVSADLTLIENEISEICGNDKLAKLEAKRKSLRARLQLLRDPDTDEPPQEGDASYTEFKKTQKVFIELSKEINSLKDANDVDISDGELSKIVSHDIMAEKALLAQVPTQIRLVRAKLINIISDICQSIDKENELFVKIKDDYDAKITEKMQEKSDVRSRCAELDDDENLVLEQETSSELLRKINRFFKDFGIVREYVNIEEALDIIKEEWRDLEKNYSKNKATNEVKIPMFKDIVNYLESSDILEEDRQRYTKKLFDNVNVFGITCTSRDRFTSKQNEDLKRYGIKDINIRTQGIDVVIIDEVSKSSFLDLLIPILYGKTVILVGDHRQLPPMYDLKHMKDEDFEGLDEQYITKSLNRKYTELYEECFFKSLYEKVPREFKIMLNKQYRCHSDIMEVFNHFYYEGNKRGLSIGESNQNDKKQHNLTVRLQNNLIIDPNHHVYFIDCNEKEENESGSNSLMNPQEADVVMALLEGLDKSALDLINRGKIKADGGRNDERPSVGVICTYGDQAGLIKRRRKNAQYAGFSKKDDEKLIISTVDDFQGDERDIIIVSMVRNPRSNHYNADFVNQFERINVAFSRARKLLIIVGAKKFLSEQMIDLPDLSGNTTLDKHGFKVYDEIIQTIDFRGRLLSASDVIKVDGDS